MKSKQQKTVTKRTLKFDAKGQKALETATVQTGENEKQTKKDDKIDNDKRESTGASAISDSSSENEHFEMEEKMETTQKAQVIPENSQEEQGTVSDTASADKVIDWNDEGLQLLGRVTNKRAASSTPEEANSKKEQRLLEDSSSEGTDETVKKKSTWQQQISLEMEKKIDNKLKLMDEKLEKLKQMIYEHRNDFRVTLEQNSELASTYDKMSELCTTGITELRKEVRAIKSNLGKVEEKAKKIQKVYKKIVKKSKQWRNKTNRMQKQLKKCKMTLRTRLKRQKKD